MRDLHGEAGECFRERDRPFEIEVVTLASERSVVDLIQNDDDITRETNPGHLITLASECNGITLLHTLFDRYFEDLLALDDLLALAAAALVLGLDGLPLPTATRGTQLASAG